MSDGTRSTQLLLIDLSSIFWPAYRATAGIDIDSAYRATIQRVHALAGKYEHTAIACDSPKSFRKEISPAYKANREKDAVAIDQIRKVQERLAADGFVLWRADGFEADDVLATASRRAVAAGHEVVIATADKDLLACVGEGIRVLHTMTGVEFGYDDVQTKLGVTPPQVPDYLALVGDKSDNVAGVKGIGATHAARLLREHGSIAGILHTIETVTPPSIRANFAAAIDDGSLAISRQLVALNYDVPGIEIGAAFAPRVSKRLTADEEGDYVDEEPEAAPHAPEAKPDPKVEAPEAPKVEAPAEPVKAVVALPVPTAELLSPDDPRFHVALEPRTGAQAWSVAKAVFNSRLFQNIPNAESAWLVIMMGRGLGIDTMTMLRGVHVIDGKICLHAAMIVGLVLRSGKADYFKLIESTAEKATYKTHRRDDADPEPTTFSFTIEDARKAQLAGVPTRSGKPSQWDKIPRTMLRWRCSTELARAVYPDIVFNLYSPDEIDSEVEVDLGEEEA